MQSNNWRELLFGEVPCDMTLGLDRINTKDGTIYVTEKPKAELRDCTIKPLIVEAFDELHAYLEKTHSTLSKSFPKLSVPHLWIGLSNAVNAASLEDKRIVIFMGLFEVMSQQIDTRFSDADIKTYNLLDGIDGNLFRNGVRRHAWHYVALHELAHVWHSHILWNKMYTYDKQGRLAGPNPLIGIYNGMMEEKVSRVKVSLTTEIDQYCLAAQAQEYDADITAINWMYDSIVREAASMDDKHRRKYIEEETAMLYAAITTAFSVLDGCEGARFEKLVDEELHGRSHPLPSIRCYYSEEQLNWLGFDHFENDISLIEKINGLRLVVGIDMNRTYGNQTGWQRQFDLAAYTRKGQAHLSNIKRRFNDMYDTMNSLSLGAMRNRLTEEEIRYSELAIQFDENGNSLRGWE